MGINVEDEERDAKSSLNNYKDLVKIRRNYSDLIAYGSTNISEKVHSIPNNKIVRCTRIVIFLLGEPSDTPEKIKSDVATFVGY